MGTTNKDKIEEYQRGVFTASDETKSAYDSLTNANNALTNLGDFNWVDQGKLDEYSKKYESRNPFSYDFNTDALYQQYKDKYIKQAKMASADVMGQAAAMNGGYGSSYAQTVGNQAYQQSLGQLNDVIPELYQLAYEKYNNEGQDMLNMISLLRGEREFAYGQHNDQYSKLANDRDYWSNMHNNLYNRDYTAYSDDEAYKYGAYRDSVADKQWQDNFDFAKQQYEDSKYANAGGQYKVSKDDKGNPVVTPDVDATVTGKSIPSKVVSDLQKYTTRQGQDDYLAKQVASGKITEDQAFALMEEHGVVPLNERTWERVSNGGWNLFGIDANAEVSDGTTTYTLKELKKQLQNTTKMSNSEINKYLKDLQKRLGISEEKGWNPFK